MNCRESLDRTMKFQDVVYYSKKLDKWQEDIETDVPWFKEFAAHYADPEKPNDVIRIIVKYRYTKRKKTFPPQKVCWN